MPPEDTEKPSTETTSSGSAPAPVGRRSVLGTLAAVPAALMLGSRASRRDGSAAACATTLGQPPPEWAPQPAAWPGYNYDLANTATPPARRSLPATSAGSRRVAVRVERRRLLGRHRRPAPLSPTEW